MILFIVFFLYMFLVLLYISSISAKVQVRDTNVYHLSSLIVVLLLLISCYHLKSDIILLNIYLSC